MRYCGLYNKYMYRIALMAAFVLAIATSCEQQDLNYDYANKKSVRIEVDWSQFTQETPTGMTVLIYDSGGKAVQTLRSNKLDYVNTSLLPGNYQTVVFNQGEGEFGTLSLNNLDSYDEASVNAMPYISRWYMKDNDENVVMNPEWFATDAQRDLTLNKEMTKGRAVVDTSFTTIASLVPHDVVYTIQINVYLKNIYNLKSARASLSGLAGGYLLGLEKPSDAKATQLIEKWTLTADKDNTVNGVLSAEIQSFGLPNNHKGQSDENKFMLSLLLVDGKTQLDYTFDVGDQIKLDDSLELTLLVNSEVSEPLPDVKPEGGSSGAFDPTVEDWGEDEKVNLDQQE